VVVLFTLTSFLTAALLFLVQPLVARMVLPAFGGSPQVWTTAMLFFQISLLVGYGYAHATTTHLGRRRQPWVHLGLALIPLMILPIALEVAPSGRGGVSPSLELLAALLGAVALPFVLVATSGPLVQRWFSWTDHPRGDDPYFLYAAGNLGSFVGLLAYPLVLEPRLSTVDQSKVWSVGYVTALVLLALCAAVVRLRARPGDETRPDPIGDAEAMDRTNPGSEEATTVGAKRAARWAFWAFIPSSLMLGATSHLSTDVAAVPLLWVAPLGIYLLTFSVAFSTSGPATARVAKILTPPAVVAAVFLTPTTFGVPVAVAAQLLLVAVGGILAHGLLAAERPTPRLLTRFYLWIAVGGALGGLFNGIVAPLLFPTVIEYGLVAALALALVIRWSDLVPGTGEWASTPRLTAAVLVAALPAAFLWLTLDPGRFGATPIRALVALGLLLALAAPLGRGGAVMVSVTIMAIIPHAQAVITAEEIDRTFFGVHRVVAVGDVMQLSHGTTLHGTQDQSSATSRRSPTTYYARSGPFGDIAETFGTGADIGVIGLGTGAIAAYGRDEQQVVFHEIDPSVVRIAKEHFTYLADSPADIEFVLGDGRLTVADVTNRYGLLVVDAFSSDSIPIHLLTLEAMTIYIESLRDDGAIAVHISNRHLDLEPVLAAAADHLGLHGLIGRGAGDIEGETPSVWVALTEDPARLDPLSELGFEEFGPKRVTWTDQRSSLLSVLR
jgi:hypothetical protein